MDYDAIASRLVARKFSTTSQGGDFPTLRCWQQEYYLWSSGNYLKLERRVLKVLVRAHLDRVENVKPVTNHKVEETMYALDRWVLLHHIESPPLWIGKTPLAPTNSPWLPRPEDNLIPFENGILNILGCVAGHPTLSDPTPELFSFSTKPYDFDPSAKAPRWKAFLRDVFENDRERIRLLQEWFGLCISPITSFQKMALLEGPTRAGKSTVLRVLQAVVGDQNTVSVPLTSLKSRFGLWPLLDKTLAVCPDAFVGADPGLIVETLKEITGEDTVMADRKMLSPVSTRIRTRIAVAVNEVPDNLEDGRALATRLLVVSFRKSYEGREDVHLEQKLVSEVQGIFNWSLKGLLRLLKTGKFTVSQLGESVRKDIVDRNSPIHGFVSSVCALGSNYHTDKDTIWRAWTAYCQDRGLQTGSRRHFVGRLRNAVPSLQERRIVCQPSDTEGGRKGDGKVDTVDGRARVWGGIAVRREFLAGLSA